MFGRFPVRGEGGGVAKMIMSFVFWATLNFLNGPLSDSLKGVRSDFRMPYATQASNVLIFQTHFRHLLAHCKEETIKGRVWVTGFIRNLYNMITHISHQSDVRMHLNNHTTGNVSVIT